MYRGLQERGKTVSTATTTTVTHSGGSVMVWSCIPTSSAADLVKINGITPGKYLKDTANIV